MNEHKFVQYNNCVTIFLGPIELVNMELSTSMTDNEVIQKAEEFNNKVSFRISLSLTQQILK